MNKTATEGARRRLGSASHAVCAAGMMSITAQAQAQAQAPLPASSRNDRSPSVATTAYRNAEHPGVAQWRRAQTHGVTLDADHFLVQPPATVRWLPQPGDEPQPRLDGR